MNNNDVQTVFTKSKCYIADLLDVLSGKLVAGVVDVILTFARPYVLIV